MLNSAPTPAVLRARFPRPEPAHPVAETRRSCVDGGELQAEIVWCESEGQLIDVSTDAPAKTRVVGVSGVL